MKPRLLLVLLTLLLTDPAGAAPEESFVEAVLRLRANTRDAQAAAAGQNELAARFPRYASLYRKNLRAPRNTEFLTAGDRRAIENEVCRRWLENLEALIGVPNCAHLRKTIEAAADSPGPAGARRRLELFVRTADLLVTAEALAGSDLEYASEALAGVPPASGVHAELTASGLPPKLADALPAWRTARDAVRGAAREGGDVGLAAAERLATGVAPLAREALRFALRGAGCEDVVYAVRSPHRNGHFYESIGYYGPTGEYLYSRGGGRLSVWNVKTNATRDLLVDDEGGAVRDPCVSFDGRTVLFSWRRTGSDYYHLYTIGVDGTGLRQLTEGEWNDIEPIWVPDGGIVFSSTRCHRWIPCNMAEVTNLHRCDADGRNIRMISSNVETETSPWMLPDGRIAYMRWEYTEKDRAIFHNLWTTHPDGTNHQLLFGNEYHLWDVWNDPKPIPGTDQIVFVAHNHGGAEHTGHVGIVDQFGGPNDHRRINYPTRAYGNVTVAWRDPFPVARDLILAARGPALVVLDQRGREIELHRLSLPGVLLHEPRNLRPEPKPPRLPSRVDLTKATGEFVIGDVYHGRHMEGVQRGDVKDILIIEELPKPVHHEGHTEPIMYNGTFMLERVLGTVPVEPDGSAYFEAPPLRSLMFVLRDKDGLSVKRMQSFATLMPGERVSCAGCHEARTEVPGLAEYLAALQRPPSKIEPVPAVPEVFSYPRDIQPIIDRNCLSCHDDATRAGGVVLDGDMEQWFTQSYVTLQARDLVGVGARGLKADMAPRTMGSSASGLVKLLRSGHQGVKPTPEEIRKVAAWVDSAGVWAGTYAAVNTTEPATLGGDRVLGDVIRRRCGECHVADGGDIARHVLLRTSNPNFGPDPHERYGVRFNLTHVERSLLLRAPLARAAGGLEICRTKDGQSRVTFSSADDPDYARMLARLRERQAEALPLRHDRPGFRPLPTYAREMRRQGLLPANFDEARDPWDPYELDRRFWASFWHVPAPPPPVAAVSSAPLSPPSQSLP